MDMHTMIPNHNPVDDRYDDDTANWHWCCCYVAGLLLGLRRKMDVESSLGPYPIYYLLFQNSLPPWNWERAGPHDQFEYPAWIKAPLLYSVLRLLLHSCLVSAPDDVDDEM